MDKLIILKDVADLGLREGDELQFDDKRNSFTLKEYNEDISKNNRSISERIINLGVSVASDMIELGEAVIGPKLIDKDEVTVCPEPMEACVCEDRPEQDPNEGKGCYYHTVSEDACKAPDTTLYQMMASEEYAELRDEIKRLSESTDTALATINDKINAMSSFFDPFKRILV